MNRGKQIDLKPGMRIVIRNQLHEICFCDHMHVRYSASKGGRSNTVPTKTFWELVDDEVIGFLGDATGPSGDGEVYLWQLNDQERAEMRRRFAYVTFALQSKYKPTSRRTFEFAVTSVSASIQDPKPPCHTVLAEWIKRYRESGGNIKALVPKGRNKGRRDARFSYEIEAEISEAIQTQFIKKRISVEQLRCNIIGQVQSKPWLKGLSLPKKRSIYRRISKLDPYLIATARFGKKYADARFRAAGESLEATRPMQFVMIDGHRMDVLVIDQETGEILGRPYLICLFDVATRAVVGWYISLMPFCATTALAAIKVMCSTNPVERPGGVPELIIPDNGPDLSAISLRNLCNWLGCHIEPAKKYSPNDKAHIERFFRTLNEMLIHLLAGATFSSPKDRGDYESERYACHTLDEIRGAFQKWINDVYHVHIHSHTQRAPLLHWRELQQTYPILSYSSAEIDVVARIMHRRTINQGRVLVDHLYYKSDALTMLAARGQKNVTVMVDELDLGFVYVQHESDSTVLYRADAVLARYAEGLTKYEHDEVRKKMLEQAALDRKALGDYSYEIARWELWQELHKVRNSRSSRRLSHLRAEMAKKTRMPSKTGKEGSTVPSSHGPALIDLKGPQAPDQSSPEFHEFTHEIFSL